jgi:hypothetical protein
MKTAMATRWLGVAGLLTALGGCAASNPVYRLKDGHLPADMRGALFALPRTRLDFGFTKTTTAFVPGMHTALVERCMAGGLVGDFCDRLAALELESLRPSLDDEKCQSDAKEKRVSYGTFTLAPSSIPDPDQVYAVQLRRHYFQNFDMDLEMDAFGVIGKGQASTTERAAEDALNFAMAAASAALSLPSPTNAAARVGAGPLPEAVADLDQLEALILRRDELVARVDADNLARSTAIVAGLNGRIGVLEAKFTGTVTKKETLASEKIIPKGKPPTGQPQYEFFFDPCGGNNKSSRLVVFVTKACADCSLVDGLPNPGDEKPQVAASSQKEPSVQAESHRDSATDRADHWSKRLNGKDGELGWPYRLPVLARVHAGTCDATGDCPLESLKLITETGIAQFGEVLRLPAGTGGRKSNIAATYTTLGSLSKLEVDQEGQDATPIFTTAEALLNRPPKAPAPSETAVLQGEIALVQARQTLCKLIYGEADTRCQSANPPTE